MFAWGSADEGQLGIDVSTEDNGLVSQPRWVPPLPESKVTKVACGYKHTLLLTSEGFVYSCGSNDFGQLGYERKTNSFTRISGLQHKIRDINCGAYHSGAITQNGKVYMWGCNTNGQLGRTSEDTSVALLNFPHGTVVQISLGVEHSVALTESSDVYVWGSNAHGQLGLGFVSQASVTTPTRIDCLGGLPVRQLVAGGYHNLLLTPSGSIYVWGSDSHGQLGLSDGHERMEVDEMPAGTSRRVSCSSCASAGYAASAPHISVPTLIKSMRKLRVTYVACGESHSVLLTQSGQLFTFGSGRFGQLGHGDNKQSGPKLVSSLSGRKVLQVACGCNHTLVTVHSNGNQDAPSAMSTPELFAFGAGSEGQLGIGDLHRRLQPTIISCNWTNKGSNDSNGFVITELFAGGHHCFALVSKRTTDPPASTLDYRVWRPCHLSNIATLNQPLLECYEQGLPEHPFLSSLRKPSLAFETQSTYGDKVYCLNAYTSETAFNRIEAAFRSVGSLASSFLVDNSSRSHYDIGRKEHGVDLDAAQQLQKTLFLRAPPTDTRKIIKCLMDTVLSHPLKNYPDLECLRALLVLSVSPLLETPRKPVAIPASSALTEPTAQVNFLDGEPINWYPAVLAGFTSPGLILGFFCMAVNRLDPVPSGVMDSWFMSFRQRHMRRLVANLNNMVACHISSEQTDPALRKLIINAMHSALELMKRLYTLNESMKDPISYTSFYIPELNNDFDAERFLNWLKQRNSMSKSLQRFTGNDAPPDFSIFDYPFIFDGAAKAKMLTLEARLTMLMAVKQAQFESLGAFAAIFSDAFKPVLLFQVSRTDLVPRTLQCLASCSPADLKRPLKVEFDGEEAVDDGGVLKEFFLLIMREILNPIFGMFKFYPESRMLWFSEANMETSDMFHMVGALCGLAIYNSIIVDLNFPLAMFKKLLGQQPTLEDLKELDPVVGKSLQQLLEYEEPDLDEVFALNFEVVYDKYGEICHIPLVENGASIPVNQANKQLYVEKYVDYRFNKSCDEPYKAFHRGFHLVCSGYALKMFRPLELQTLVVGSEEINWFELRRAARYQGEYWDQHPVIKWFWEVLLEDCTVEDKKNFLRFLTGCDRAPVHGIGGIQIVIQPTSGGDSYLPVAHTCYNLLDLPKYSSKEILKSKFMQAIENTEGFALV